MNISLIYPLLSKARSRVDENKQYWPPLGLAYIAAVLEKNNHRVKIIDRDIFLHRHRFDFGKVDEITLKEIELFGTDIVGISATTPNMDDVMHLSSLIKQRNPKIKIILGGPHATCESSLTLQTCSHIDVIVRGEGEFTMLDLANGLEPEKIEGVSFRYKDRVINNPDRPLCADLDDLPFPARHLLDMEFYTRPSRFAAKGLNLRTTSVFSARGCPYRCDFCAGYLTFPGKVRFHSPQRIIEEIAFVVDNYSTEAIFFVDDMFLSLKDRIREFLRLLKENKKLQNIKWIAQARANVIDEDILRLLKEGGCVGLEYGFESGSQGMLDIMNKRSTIEDNFRAAILTRKVGLRFTSYIIVGYPGETESDFKKTVSFLKKVKPNVISFSLFYPLPGTAIYKRLVSQRQKIPEWNRVGDSESADINYSNMDNEAFKKLYFKTRLTVILPNNLYHFIKDNIRHPISLFTAFAVQFKGVIIKNLRAIRYLLQSDVR